MVFWFCSFAVVSMAVTTQLFRRAHKGSVYKVIRLLAIVTTEVLVESYAAASNETILRAVYEV